MATGAARYQPPHHLLRRAAYGCLLRLEAAEAKVQGGRRGGGGGGAAALEGKPASRVVRLALGLVAREPLPSLRVAVMVELLTMLGGCGLRGLT